MKKRGLHKGVDAGKVLKNLNTELLYDSAILLLSIYPKELQTDIQQYTCTQMFIATIFIITKK